MSKEGGPSSSSKNNPKGVRRKRDFQVSPPKSPTDTGLVIREMVNFANALSSHHDKTEFWKLQQRKYIDLNNEAVLWHINQKLDALSMTKPVAIVQTTIQSSKKTPLIQFNEALETVITHYANEMPPNRSLNEEGVFRIPGANAAIKTQIMKDPEKTVKECKDVHEIMSALKHNFKTLPWPDNAKAILEANLACSPPKSINEIENLLTAAGENEATKALHNMLYLCILIKENAPPGKGMNAQSIATLMSPLISQAIGLPPLTLVSAVPICDVLNTHSENYKMAGVATRPALSHK